MSGAEECTPGRHAHAYSTWREHIAEFRTHLAVTLGRPAPGRHADTPLEDPEAAS